MPIEQVITRIRRALLLDPAAFVEARDDNAFTPYALGAAAIAVVLGAIGAFFWSLTVLEDAPGGFFWDSVILGSLFLILLWALGFAVTYLLLAQLFRQDVLPDGLARVLSLGYLPFAFSFLVLVPGIGFGFGMLAVCAMFFYTIFGLRAAYSEIDPLAVMISVLCGFAVWLMVLPLLTGPNDAFAPGPFVFEWSEDVAQDISSLFRISEVDLGDFLPPVE